MFKQITTKSYEFIILIKQLVISYKIKLQGATYELWHPFKQNYNNHIIKFNIYNLKLPSFTNTDFIYKEFNIFNFDKLLNKCT